MENFRRNKKNLPHYEKKIYKVEKIGGRHIFSFTFPYTLALALKNTSP